MAVLAYDDVWMREPRLMVPRKQPLSSVAWNCLHPNANVSWAYLFRPRDGFAQLAGNRGLRRLTPVTPTWYARSDGIGLGSTGERATLDSNAPMFVTSTGNGAGSFSCLWVSQPTSVADFNLILHNRVGSGIYENVLIGVNGYYADNASASTVAAGYVSMTASDSATNARGVYAENQIDGLVHCWIGVRNGGVMKLYRDGAFVTSRDHGATITDVYNSGQAFAIGGSTNNAAMYLTAPTFFIAEWDYALSDGQAMDLSYSPYQLLIPA